MNNEEAFKNLKLAKITVLVKQHGADQISFQLDALCPFPELLEQELNDAKTSEAKKFITEGYAPHLRMDVRKGYAEAWLKKQGFTQYEVIDVNTGAKKTVSVIK